MNAITPIIPACETPAKAAAKLLWNQQRGQLIDAFTVAEFAVTETLQLLASIEGRGDGIKINPNLQGRFTQLIKLLAPAGAFTSEGKAIVEPLQDVSQNIGLRNMLCHGRATMYFDDKGRWIVQLEMLTVVKGGVETKEILLSQANVRQALKDVKSSSARAVSQLAQLRKNLGLSKRITPSAPVVPGSR